MIRTLIAWSVAALGATLAAGCGSPFLHSVTTAGTTVRDPGLTGEWTCKNGSETRAVIAAGPSDTSADPYRLSLTVYDKGEIKSSLNLELTMIEVGETRFADLFLARSERDKLVGAYGFLAVPVHQVMKIARDGDTLKVWSFRGEWPGDKPDDARDRITVGGGEAAIFTASGQRVREMLARHADDPQAFDDLMVFRRTPLKR